MPKDGIPFFQNQIDKNEQIIIISTYYEDW